MNNTKTAAAAAALLFLAACSYRLPEKLAADIFCRYSYVPADQAKVLSLLREKGAAGLKELDPYAELLKDRREVKAPSEDAPLSAGMLIGRSGASWRALRVFKDGPAAAAGLKDGDILISAAGAPAGTAEFLAALENREFDLKAARRSASGDAPLEAKVRKARFRFPSLFGVYDPAARTAFVRVPLFFPDCAADVIKGLDVMASYGARNVVFDLRGNKGGSPEDAAQVLAVLAEKPGRLMFIEARGGDAKTYSTKLRGRHAALRPAVLVDGSTAMAAEVFASSLRELRGARLVGTRTAGRVRLQRSFKLPRGRSLRFTVASLKTSSGADLEGKGAAPDENFETPAAAAAAWKNASATAFADDPAYAKAAGLFR